MRPTRRGFISTVAGIAASLWLDQIVEARRQADDHWPEIDVSQVEDRYIHNECAHVFMDCLKGIPKGDFGDPEALLKIVLPGPDCNDEVGGYLRGKSIPIYRHRALGSFTFRRLWKTDQPKRLTFARLQDAVNSGAFFFYLPNTVKYEFPIRLGRGQLSDGTRAYAVDYVFSTDTLRFMDDRKLPLGELPTRGIHQVLRQSGMYSAAMFTDKKLSWPNAMSFGAFAE